ncbi:MAG: class I SAM-dependent methyltransferase [Acidobacteriota bacterium]|nr:class I SAM-dependent methyltransferase [Acidobacteriota bacterium]
MKKWYEELFIDYAKTYDRETFTKGTLQEVGFIEKEIRKNKRIRILDVGCGTGRHSIELARRGYAVTGLDLSLSQLKRAREKARAAGVKVEFLRKDARRFDFRGRFGLVIMLCEGGFPLMETDEMNFRILENCAKSLRKGGKFIFSTLNALYPLVTSLKEILNEGAVGTKTSKISFDIATLREDSVLEAVDDNGKKKTLCCNERFYMPSELAWMLKTLGFRKVEIFGGTIGEFNRKVKPSPKEFELLVVAEK